MKAEGERQERETIINFNEADDQLTIWTASGVVYNRLLKRLGRAHLTEDGDRHAVFTCPAKWLLLPRVKKPRALAPKAKATLVARLHKNRRLPDKGD